MKKNDEMKTKWIKGGKLVCGDYPVCGREDEPTSSRIIGFTRTETHTVYRLLNGEERVVINDLDVLVEVKKNQASRPIMFDKYGCAGGFEYMSLDDYLKLNTLTLEQFRRNEKLRKAGYNV